MTGDDQKKKKKKKTKTKKKKKKKKKKQKTPTKTQKKKKTKKKKKPHTKSILSLQPTSHIFSQWKKKGLFQRKKNSVRGKG